MKIGSFRLLFGCLLCALALGACAQVPAPPKDLTDFPTTAKIYCVVVNSFWKTNCYILASAKGQAIVIDPGDELEWLGDDRYRILGTDAARIYEVITTNKLTVKQIVVTHGHLDHFGALGFLKEKTGAEIIMHEKDVRPKGDPFAGYPKDTRMFEKGTVPKVDRTVKDGDLLSVDGMVLEVLHTPGHSPGSISLRTRREGRTLLFSGDTLMRRTIGRTNFRDGSGDQDLLYKVIREKFYTLPDTTVVLPGHYDATTIKEEKAENPFVKP